jgi:O-antigen/teichoic acid export membrane protein
MSVRVVLFVNVYFEFIGIPKGLILAFIARAVDMVRSGKGLEAQLLRGGIGSVAVKIGSTLLNLILGVVLARSLGTTAFGAYSFVFAFVSILVIPAQLGLPTLLVRETAKAGARRDWPRMRALWRWSSIMAIGASSSIVVILVIALWAFPDWLPREADGTAWWALPVLPLLVLNNLRCAALRGLHHVVKGQLPDFVLRPAFLIALVLGCQLAFPGGALGSTRAMMLNAAACLMAFLVGARLLIRASPPSTPRGQSSPAPMPSLMSLVPLALLQGMYVVNQNAGAIVLGLLGSADNVGLFRVAMQGAMLASIFLAAVNIAASPHLSRLHAQDDKPALQRVCVLASVSSGFCALIVLGVYVILGRSIITFLFGVEFAGAYVPLVILTIGQVFNAYTALAGSLLLMTGNERRMVPWALASGLFNFTVLAAGVHEAGLVGAAVGTTATLIFWNTVLVFICWKKIEILPLFHFSAFIKLLCKHHRWTILSFLRR